MKALARIFFSMTFIVHTALADTGPLGFGSSSYSQDMETDRPDFTEGTQTVQKGHFQLEVGYTYTTNDDDVDADEHVFPEILFRGGLTNDLELRIGWDGAVILEGDADDSGTSDMSLGLKHRVYEEADGWPAISILADLGIPVGSKEFTSDEVEPSGSILWAKPLGDESSVAGNVNFSFPEGEEERYFEVSSSLALGTALSDEIDGYVEYYGFYPAESVVETTEHYANGGFTYAITSDLQADIRAGFGINDAAADFLSGVGLSVRY